jgi:AraC family transcriptional regulator
MTIGPVKGEYGLLMVMSGQVDITLRDHDRSVNVVGEPGTTYLLSGDRPLNLVRIEGLADAAAIRIAPEWFGRLSLAGAPTSFGRAEPLLRDQTVLSLVKAMCQEITNNATTGRFFAESMSMALLSYIVDRLPASDLRYCGRLSEAQCRRLKKFIRDNLCEELPLSRLANLVNISPRYFTTLFREAFGATPHQYVLSVRLAEAARLLESRGEDIVAIAMRLGFSSQSHFSSAFRRAFGVTPSRYTEEKRKRPCDVQPVALTP